MTPGETGTTADSSAVAKARPAESKLDRWGRWLTPGADTGGVLGLIIVIVEARQNATLTRTAMEQQKNTLLADIELSLAKREMAEVWVKSIRTPEDLTDAEARMVESHLVALMLQWDYMFQMESAGLISRAHARQHTLNSAPYCFGSRFAKNWWSLQAAGWQGTPMMEIAGPIFDGIDEDFLASNLDHARFVPAPTDAEPDIDVP